MKSRLAAGLVIIIAGIGLLVPRADAAPRKPFHCHYDYTGRSWVTFFLPEWTLHCDRVWN
jgi:hypothetical protein